MLKIMKLGREEEVKSPLCVLPSPCGAVCFFGSLGHLIPFALGAHVAPGLRGAAERASRGWRAARKKQRVLAALYCSEVLFSPRLGFCRASSSEYFSQNQEAASKVF